MGAGRVNVGGSAPIKGLVEEYNVVTADVSMNSFIKFVETRTEGAFVNGSTADSNVISCGVLDSTRVAICYIRQITGTRYVYAQVAKISGDTVTLGPEAKISECEIYPIKFVVTGTDVGCVFFSNLSANPIRAYVLTFSDTTIVTHGGNTLIDSGLVHDAIVLDSGEVLLNWCDKTNTQLAICTITQYTVAVKQRVDLLPSWATHSKICRLPDGRYVTICPQSTGITAYIFTVAESINIIATKKISTVVSSTMSIVALSNNRVAVVSANNSATGILIAIDGDIISVLFEDTIIVDSTAVISIVQINTSKFDMLYRRATGAGNGCRRTVYVSNNRLVVGESDSVAFTASTTATCMVPLDAKNIFSAAIGDGRLKVKMSTVDIGVAPAETIRNIHGIATTPGTIGEKVKIKTL